MLINSMPILKSFLKPIYREFFNLKDAFLHRENLNNFCKLLAFYTVRIPFVYFGRKPTWLAKYSDEPILRGNGR